MILSDGLWRRLFGGDPAAIGKTLNLNDVSHTIVGVMAPGFRFPDSDTELWVPVGTHYPASEFTNRGRHNWMVAARLAPGVSLERANSEIHAIAHRLEQQYPDTNRGIGAFVAPMREHFVGETRTILVVLSAAVGFVLLIACVNIANLLLARAGNRKREIAIRTAIGAGRYRLVCQLLTESLLLSCAGGLGGLALAFWSLPFLVKLVPKGISGLTVLHVDARVLAFTLAISILTGVAFGLFPAFRTMQVDLNQVLKQGGGRQTAGRGSRWLERSLVIAEVALAFVLTTGAGLMIQAFAHLRNADPGFRTHNLLAVRTRMPNRLFVDDARRNAFLDESLRRVRALPPWFRPASPWACPSRSRDGQWIHHRGTDRPGRRPILQLQLPRGHARLPADTGRPLAARPRHRRPRSARRAPGCRGERNLRAQVLAFGKRRREALPIRGKDLNDHVRRGGHIHQAGLAAAPRAEMYLPAAGSLSHRLAGDSHRRRPSQIAAPVRREFRPWTRICPSARSAAWSRSSMKRYSTTAPSLAAHRLRRARSAAGRGRHLWRAGVHGGSQKPVKSASAWPSVRGRPRVMAVSLAKAWP